MQVISFSKEHADNMHVGETFETDGVFPGVSSDKLVWKVVSARGQGLKIRYFLEARYLNIYFGSFSFAIKNGQWTLVGEADL